AAPDFMLLRTTKRSMTEFLQCFPFEGLDSRMSFSHWPGGTPLLILRETSSPEFRHRHLSFYDSSLTKRLELAVDARMGHRCRAGLELPQAGLQVVRAWAEDGSELTVPPTRILSD